MSEKCPEPKSKGRKGRKEARKITLVEPKEMKKESESEGGDREVMSSPLIFEQSWTSNQLDGTWIAISKALAQTL